MSTGCVFITAEDQRSRIDADGDGVSVLEDCDDARAAVFPGAEEACDGLDNDCDGEVDEGLFPDADGDGFGGVAEGGCQVDWQPVSGDCDDADPEVFPGQVERCNGRDDGCVAGWTPEHELGVVSWVGADGAWVDRSAEFPTDRGDEPARVALDPAGTLHLCRGSAPFHVRITQGEVDSVALIGRAIPLAEDELEEDALPVLSGVSASSPGPTVLLAGPGGRVDLRALVLTGGLTTTTLPGGGLHLNGLRSAQLSNVVIQANQAAAGSPGGAGLYAGNITDLQLSHVQLRNNSGVDGTSGGGALIENSNLRLFAVELVDNRAAAGGGLAFLGEGFRLDGRGGVFRDNRGNRFGGGLYLGPGARAYLAGTQFTDNHADQGGAAFTEGSLSCFGDDAELASTWADNFADTCGAAAAVAGEGAVSFAGCTASGSSVSASSSTALCGDAPDLARLETAASRAPGPVLVTGDSLYCSWTACHGDVEVLD